MCIKFDSVENDIFLLEATSNLGVHLKRFSSIVPHIGGFYARIALRRMNFVRTDEQLEKLEKFVKDSLGKPYKFALN